MWISALLFRFLVPSEKQHLPLPMGQCFSCPEGIKACLSGVWCSSFNVNFSSHFMTTLQAVFCLHDFSHFFLTIRSWRTSWVVIFFLSVWNCMIPALENLSLRARVCAVQTLCYLLSPVTMHGSINSFQKASPACIWMIVCQFLTILV